MSSSLRRTVIRPMLASFKKTDGRQFYHFVQSFSEDDNLTPEEANTIGVEFAQKQFPDFEVLVATHIDTDHLHNHLVVNSVSCDELDEALPVVNVLQRLVDRVDQVQLPAVTPQTGLVLTGLRPRTLEPDEGWMGEAATGIIQLGRSLENSADLPPLPSPPTVVGSIGDVTELFEDLKDRSLFLLPEEQRRKRAVLKAAAVGIYIFAGVVFIISMVVSEMYYALAPEGGILGTGVLYVEHQHLDHLGAGSHQEHQPGNLPPLRSHADGKIEQQGHQRSGEEIPGPGHPEPENRLWKRLLRLHGRAVLSGHRG